MSRRHEFSIKSTNYAFLAEKQRLLHELLPTTLVFVVEGYLEGASFLVAPSTHRSLPYEVEREHYTHNLCELTLMISDSFASRSELEEFMEQVMNVCTQRKRKRLA